MGLIQVRNLAELPEWSAERLGERRTMSLMGQDITNFQTLDRAKRFHRAFGELGLGPGDVAALCMVNHPYVYAVFGGIFRTGATAVPLMFQLTAPELRYIIGHTEARCVVTDSNLVDKVREAVVGLDHVEWIAILGGDDKPDATPREYKLDTLLESGPQSDIPNIAGDDVAMMLYTSGTTGKPKGVMLTHDNLLACAEAAYSAAEYSARESAIISINALPMAHIFGVGVMNQGYLFQPDDPPLLSVQEVWFDPARFFTLIDEHQVTDLIGVPTMLALLLSHPDQAKHDLRSIQYVTVGAAPLPVDLARQFADRCECRIRQIYGMTENAGIGSADRASRPYRPGASGYAYPKMELRIVDDTGNDMPTGQPGEIVTRGPSTMKGYFKDPEATANTIRHGWLHTGDIGYLDEDGYLFVVDRKKDMIIKGGENIFPAEVEQALYEHPGVAEAAVVGAPHATFGETVVAFVVARGGHTLEEDQLIAFVKDRITPFKAPSRIHIEPVLPKSGVGKILRRELRTRAGAEHAAVK